MQVWNPALCSLRAGALFAGNGLLIPGADDDPLYQAGIRGIVGARIIGVDVEKTHRARINSCAQLRLTFIVLLMDLRGKMELDLGVIGSLCIQKPFTLSEVDKVTVLVFGNIGVFETGEIFQFFGILARDPAGLEERLGIKLHRGAVFV
jgi:hypothetical protein